MTKILVRSLVLCLATGFVAAATLLSLPAADDPVAGRKVFANSVVPLPAQPGLTKSGLMIRHAAAASHKEDKMTILFSFAIPKEARKKLAARVARGEVVTPKELRSAYAPKPEDVTQLRDWLKEQGFTIKHTSADQTGIYAEARVSQIEKSLQVKMVRVTKNGLSYNAAQNAPSLPEKVGAGVQAVIGLQPFRQVAKHSRRHPRTPARNVSGNAPPYLVAEVLKAYDAASLGVTGAGQKIAILIDTVPANSDLKNFWTRNNVSVKLSQVKKINVTGVTLPPPDGEETLDVEWSTGIAPGATVHVYASGTLQFVDIDRALDRIIADAMADAALRQVSISLGLGETFMPSGEAQIQSDKYLTLAALGVNVFVSSGDAGSNPDETGHGSTGPQQVECSASDPSVVGVGGTSLALASNGTVSQEEGWPGSGGGTSTVFDRPDWQKGKGVPAGAKRLVPDVSLTADPNRGAFVFLNGSVVQYGGTSWSAPVWAGFCALMNEARQKAGKPTLPFLNPLIYPLGEKCFRDITVGSNGAFSAGPGYDQVTGLGVPNIKLLIKELTQ